MTQRLNFRIFYVIAICVFANAFMACDNDDDVPSIDLRELCQVFPSKQVMLTLNGEVIDEAGDVGIVFPDLQVPEGEVFESEMLLEMLSLWPDCSILQPFPHHYFEIDVVSSPDKVTFTGEVRGASLYNLSIEGCFENDVLKLDLTYKAGRTELIGNTYELPLDVDALDFRWLSAKKDAVEWNGEMVPVEDFVRQAFKPIFSGFVENTGYDAVRFTFLEDGSMEMSYHDSQRNTYIPAFGHYAYRFHDYNFGCFEMGEEEAAAFSDALFPYTSSIPNGLFWFTARRKAFIPVCYQRDREDNLFMALRLKDNSTLARFLSEWTMDISDSSEEVQRMREVSNMLYREEMSDLIMIRAERQ